MINTKPELEQKIEQKKLTVKQLEHKLKQLELQQTKAKDKLTKQIEREKQKEFNSQARKQRNKKIYDWGGLIPLVFGPTEFDKLADSTELKNCLIGLLIKTQLELKTNGFGLTPENKPKWLEYYKNQGKKFLDEHTSK